MPPLRLACGGSAGRRPARSSACSIGSRRSWLRCDLESPGVYKHGTPPEGPVSPPVTVRTPCRPSEGCHSHLWSLLPHSPQVTVLPAPATLCQRLPAAPSRQHPLLQLGHPWCVCVPVSLHPEPVIYRREWWLECAAALCSPLGGTVRPPPKSLGTRKRELSGHSLRGHHAECQRAGGGRACQ